MILLLRARVYQPRPVPADALPDFCSLCRLAFLAVLLSQLACSRITFAARSYSSYGLKIDRVNGTVTRFYHPKMK